MPKVVVDAGHGGTQLRKKDEQKYIKKGDCCTF